MRNSAISPGGHGVNRAILAASVGNLLEWYDFSVYALFAIYIAANFWSRAASSDSYEFTPRSTRHIGAIPAETTVEAGV
jgi:hypothetical protein